MRIRPAACAALLVASLAPVLTAPPAGAAAARYADDFNGDGYRDYAGYTYEQYGKGGGVRITFGTASGPGTQTHLITQDSPGVPGADETEDQFGDVRVPADFNADGYGDLAVSVSREDVDGRTDEGGVVILWGSATGLSGGTAIPNAGAKVSNARFGRDLAAGDFNGDGKQDLAAISGSKAYVYRSITRTGVAGSVTSHDKTTRFAPTSLVSGNMNGDSKTDLVIIGITDEPDNFGTDAWFIKGGSPLSAGKTLRLVTNYGDPSEAVIADFDKDGYGDLAAGSQMYNDYQGRVSIWYGSSTGPATTVRITQATTNVAGTPESGDLFGSSVSAADINGDGYKDLAIGVYGEKISQETTEGGVHVLRGSASGITGTNAQWLARNTAGVPGDVAWNDCFGEPVRLRDTNRDGKADLHVGAVNGSLRFPGTSSGVTTTGVTDADTELVWGMLQ